MTTRVKTGGRKRGSIDREERKILTDEMAADLVWCYAKMGGRTWLLEYAKTNPKEFIQFGLSRLWPAPQKDGDGDGFTQNNQINFNSQDTFEVSRRIAFALSLGLELAAPAAPVVERELAPEINPNEWRPPVDAPHMTPVEDPDLQRWVQTPDQSKPPRGVFIFDEKDPRPYDVQYGAWDLCRNTKDNTIESYKGSTPEQGGHGPVQRPAHTVDPRAAQRDRMLRRKELL